MLGGLLTCLLSGSGFAASTRSQAHCHSVKPATAGADSIFVVNPATNALSVFPSGSSGNAPSLVTNPGLASPSGIARDSAGNIYVANSGGSAISVYAPGATGSPNPIAMIAGSNTGLNYPVGIAVDSSGNIFVADAGSSDGGTDNIFVFPSGSNGNVAPIAVRFQYRAQLAIALALGSTGNIYVTNDASQFRPGSVTVYSAGSNGNVPPVTTLAVRATGLVTPAGITGGGDPLGTVEMFPAGSTGNTAPTLIMAGSCSCSG